VGGAERGVCSISEFRSLKGIAENPKGKNKFTEKKREHKGKVSCGHYCNRFVMLSGKGGARPSPLISFGEGERKKKCGRASLKGLELEKIIS